MLQGYLGKTLIWTGFVLSVLICGYSILGMIMTAWISATPGEHDLAKLEFRAYMWLASALVFFVISIYLVYLGLRNGSKGSAENN